MLTKRAFIIKINPPVVKQADKAKAKTYSSLRAELKG
jgi:hypothetical protein